MHKASNIAHAFLVIICYKPVLSLQRNFFTGSITLLELKTSGVDMAPLLPAGKFENHLKSGRIPQKSQCGLGRLLLGLASTALSTALQCGSPRGVPPPFPRLRLRA